MPIRGSAEFAQPLELFSLLQLLWLTSRPDTWGYDLDPSRVFLVCLTKFHVDDTHLPVGRVCHFVE